MLGRALRDDPADRIDPLRLWRVDQRAGHLVCILGRIDDNIDHAIGEASFRESLDDEGMGIRFLYDWFRRNCDTGQLRLEIVAHAQVGAFAA